MTVRLLWSFRFSSRTRSRSAFLSASSALISSLTPVSPEVSDSWTFAASGPHFRSEYIGPPGLSHLYISASVAGVTAIRVSAVKTILFLFMTCVLKHGAGSTRVLATLSNGFNPHAGQLVESLRPSTVSIVEIPVTVNWRMPGLHGPARPTRQRQRHYRTQRCSMTPDSGCLAHLLHLASYRVPGLF